MSIETCLISGYLHLTEPKRKDRQQDLYLAVIEFSTAIEKYHGDSHALALLYNGRGYAFYEQGCLAESEDKKQTLLKKAQTELETAIRYEGSMVAAHHNLGLVYALISKSKQAVQQLTYPIPDVPTDPRLDISILLYNRGCVYHGLHRAEAQKDLIAALDLNKNLPLIIYSFISDILVQKHQTREAIEYFTTATNAMDNKDVLLRDALDYIGAIYAANVLLQDNKANIYARDAKEMKVLDSDQVDFIKEGSWCRCPEGTVATIFPFRPIIQT